MVGLYFSLALLSSTAELNVQDNNADQDAPELIEVSGRALKSVGDAMTGSSGTVGYEDLKNRPIARVGEILEVVPGLIATQHSGTGKANQFFLRGFNLDHGTDFATFVDGIPINMRSHGHGQGYSDLNILIPELVERVDFKKGPYHVEAGDFSSAGSASIRTYDRLANNIAEITHGRYGYRRAIVAAGFDPSESTHLLAAFESERYDGPFEIKEDLKKLNGMIKLSGGSSGIDWRISATGYDATWNSTDQIPQRLVEGGTLDAYGSLDPDLGGMTKRYSVAAEMETDAGSISAYFVDYELQLYSNFTYFMNDRPAPTCPGFPFVSCRLKPQEHLPPPDRPLVGDEIEQYDNRQLYGADLDYGWHISGPIDADLQVGAGFRHDNIDEVGLHGTQSRVRHTLIRSDVVGSTSYNAFAKLSKSFDRIRIEAGLRADTMDVDVVATRPQNSGETSATTFSPSLSVAARLSDQIEVYANYGERFHSNDARGTTISIDPVSGQSVDSVPLLAKSRGAEFGMRYETGSFKASLIGFLLDLDSELVYVGDAGTVEVQGATRRYGLETNMFWQMADWATLHASYAWTQARFKNEIDSYVPNAVPNVLSAGLKLEPIEQLTSNLILRHVGSAPLIEDGSVRSNAVTTVNWGGFYEIKNIKFGVEILNLMNSKSADISYYFESQLENETAPVLDVHAHPMVPRQFRFSTQVSF